MFWFEAAASCSYSQLWAAVKKRVIMGESCLSGEQETGAGFLHGSGAGVEVELLQGLSSGWVKGQGTPTWLSFWSAGLKVRSETSVP